MLLINMMLTEVDRHEEKESKTTITGQQGHKDKQHKLLNHISNLEKLSTGNSGGRNLPVLRWILMHFLQELINDLVFVITRVLS